MAKVDESRYYLRKIAEADKDKASIAFGAEKRCYLFRNFIVFSEDVSGFSSEKIQAVLINKLIKQQNTQYLKNGGVNTPAILDIQMDGNRVFEIQERAPGDVLFYTNESNIINIFYDKDSNVSYPSFKDMPEKFRNDFTVQLLKRNLNMQKVMKDGSKEFFKKFLFDIKTLEEYGINLDLHGENFLYSPKYGFSSIDLPTSQCTDKKKYSEETLETTHLIFDDKKIKNIEKYRDVPHSKILYDACKIFADSLKYAGNVFDEKDQEVVYKIKKNNTSLVERLFESSKELGFNITEQEYDKLGEMCSSFCHKTPTIDFESAIDN